MHHPRPDKDPRLNHLHRVTTRKQHWPELCVFALTIASNWWISQVKSAPVNPRSPEDTTAGRARQAALEAGLQE
ncbi:DUF2090 domain-containing protein [Salmonella enterica subsp. enterica]|nr:DUF2090 domain-containing protein [Salmonella enterica subsp. enterica]